MNLTINNYLLKYRTFDELLADVMNDFESYTINNMIDPSKLIKVARSINSSLGPKIRTGEDMNSEAILYVDHGKSKLPSNFYKADFASICFNYTLTTTFNEGRSYVDGCKVILPPDCNQECPEPVNPCVRINECGNEYFLIEKTRTETRLYKSFGKVNILNQTPRDLQKKYYNPSETNAHIKGGFMYFNIDEGKVYLAYQSDMEDDEGNLLVPDHPLINGYYEYGLKRKILDDLFINDESVVNKIKLNDIRYSEAKNQAITFVNTPDFAEISYAYDMDRRDAIRKYYAMFK